MEWASHCLSFNEEASGYLSSRGVSSYQSSRHSLGYVGGSFCPDPVDDPFHNSLCENESHRSNWCDTCRFISWSSTWESLDQDSKKTRHVGKRIHGSIVFPLTSYSGNIVGFQTRSIKGKSFDTFLCSKRPEGFFFGTSANIHSIWSSKEVMISEGPSDQLILERLVSDKVLAITTSSPNLSQIRFLKRFVKRVLLCLDLDKAGRDGASSFISKYGSNFDIVDVNYRHASYTAKDPNDLWKCIGDDPFRSHFSKLIRS